MRIAFSAPSRFFGIFYTRRPVSASSPPDFYMFFLLALPGRPQQHQDLVFNAPGGIGGKLGAGFGAESVHRLHQPQRAYGHQVFPVEAGHGVFFRDVGYQAQIVLDQPPPGVLVPRLHGGDGLLLLLPGEGPGKAAPAGHDAEKEQRVPEKPIQKRQHHASPPALFYARRPAFLPPWARLCRRRAGTKKKLVRMGKVW